MQSLSRQAISSGVNSGMQVTATMTEEEDDSDTDSDYDPNGETALETYTTPLDDDDCEIDEYFIFKEVMQSL